ncbi:BatD family protein [Candidatus Chromulinivorax destructor]|uniref:Protein BatD n=1 Tax=Candidatus Chromulinivorax destructor TaxID=2066483 RepID=A0A345ZCD4_9BACT|nr:BatD family protein [Candidatus Chromulinivorax destructor]AXK60951.1 hypothetical protein C0J27_04415 [Candidatus Chromulinivorax destructor]
MNMFKQKICLLNVIVYFFLVTSNDSMYATNFDMHVLNVSLKDMNYCTIDQIKRQTPCILQIDFISDKGGEKEFDLKPITGLDNFKHSHYEKTVIIFMDNGKLCYKHIYKYILEGHRKGVYSVGPFIVKNSLGNILKSSRISVVIGDETLVCADQVCAVKYFTQAELAAKSVYLYEKNILNIHFFDRIGVAGTEIVFPDFKNIKIVDVQKTNIAAIESIDGYDYVKTTWTVEFYPIDQGIIPIDEVKIKFLDQQLENKSHARGASRRFGFMMKVERSVPAPFVHLAVKPLPLSHYQLQGMSAVGQFSQLMITTDTSTILQGQGIALTLKLCGSGNLEMIDFNRLILPKSFQYYHADTKESTYNKNCKQFEFIVQANEHGMYQIPCQEFFYFDPADATYKILKSNVIDIMVTSHYLDKDKEYEKKTMQDDGCIAFDCTNINDYIFLDETPGQSSIMSISLVWYERYLHLLLLLCMMTGLYGYVFKQYLFTHDTWKRYFLFLVAYKNCRRAQLKNNAGGLYAIFLNLFIALDYAHMSIMNEERIEKYLEKHHFSEQEIIRWKIFYSKLLQVSFAQSTTLDSKILFQESFMWLQQLKEKI